MLPADKLEDEYEFDPDDLKEIVIYDPKNNMHRLASSWHKEQWCEPAFVQRARHPNTGQVGHSVLVMSGLRKIIREEVAKALSSQSKTCTDAPQKRGPGRPRKEPVEQS